MKAPILQPGRPGDLLMIARAMTSTLENERQKSIDTGEPTNDADIAGIAMATVAALRMWLGETPVAEVPTIFQH